MTTAQATIISRAAQRIGARIGTVRDGSLTTAVLTGLVGTTGDDSAYAGDRIMFLEAQEPETDDERLITGWADATGTATFAARQDDAVDELFALVPREDYTLAEYRTALADAARYSRVSYRYALPITPNLTSYPLSALTWLEGAGDVDRVWQSYSPVMLHNEDFALWQDPALAPDGWTLDGTSATVARVSGGIRSAYAARVTRSSNDATLYQSIPKPLLQYLTRAQGAVRLPWRIGAWVVCSTASRARVGLYNGSTTAWSGYHTGSGRPEWLTPTTAYTPSATGTETDCRLVCSVDTGDAAADFHATVLLSGTSLPDQARDRGSQSFGERDIDYTVRNVGGIPTVELLTYPSQAGQLIIASRRPLAELTSDADTVDDQYARQLENGLLAFLLDVHKPNQDRTRLDVMLKEAKSTWLRSLQKTTDLPVAPPISRSIVMGV